MIVIHLPRINVLRASNTWTEVQSNSHGNSSAMTSTAIFCHSICSSATNLERKTSCEKSRQLSYRPTTYYWPPLKFVHRLYRNLLSYWIGLSILNKRKLKRINPSKHNCRNNNYVRPMRSWIYYKNQNLLIRWSRHFLQDTTLVLDDLTIPKALMSRCYHWKFGLQETHTWRLAGFQATTVLRTAW